MQQFTSVGSDGHARRAHLALIEGGAAETSSASATLRATSVLGSDPVLRASVRSVARPATTYAAGVEAPRSNHETGVRAVAQAYDDFESALLPMVLASGVSGESAQVVADTIMASPQLRAQAERAFRTARIDGLA